MSTGAPREGASRPELNNSIPDVVVRRLPFYARALAQLIESGSETVSSSQIAAATSTSAAQVRRDLSYFGGFGTQGRGYDAEYLLSAIRAILHSDQEWLVALVGAGALGRAIARHTPLAEQGFRIAHVYDHNPRRIGSRIDGTVVEDVADLPERVRLENIQVAILAVPARAAQDVTNVLVDSGVRAILNYSPATLQVPPEVRVHDMDPVAALQSLAFYLTPSPAQMRDREGISS